MLGADVQMVLDVCPPLPSPPGVVPRAVERTAKWAAAPRPPRREGQALFGVARGIDDALRVEESANRTVEIGFDGYGIGGLWVGETTARWAPHLRRH